MTTTTNTTTSGVKTPAYRHIINILASFIIMCCAGSVYAWSIFVAPLKTELGLTTAHTQLIFGVIIACFSLIMLFVYRIERRLGFRWSAAIGAALFGAGYLLAAYSGGRVALILLGIGVFSGVGMGFGYITVLTNLIKWFPHHRGLAAGIAVAGFGSGAIVLSQIVQPLLAAGVAVTDIFRNVGIIYGLLYLVGALAVSTPAPNEQKSMEKPVSIRQLSRDRRFWILFYAFFAGSFAGLMFIGNLKPLGLSYGLEEGIAATAIILMSLGNASGRIIWGQIYDKVGGKKSVTAALVLLSAFTLLLIAKPAFGFQFLALALAIGLCFGANFVLYASEVSRIYGVDQFNTIYPLVSLAYGISGIIGPLVGGWIFDITDQYSVPIIIAAAICLTGILPFLVFMRNKR